MLSPDCRVLLASAIGLPNSSFLQNTARFVSGPKGDSPSQRLMQRGDPGDSGAPGELGARGDKGFAGDAGQCCTVYVISFSNQYRVGSVLLNIGINNIHIHIGPNVIKTPNIEWASGCVIVCTLSSPETSSR